MLEDIREQAETAPFIDEEADQIVNEERSPQLESHFLGLTPAQRFVIALMILLVICILTTFTLLVTEKIVPPLLS